MVAGLKLKYFGIKSFETQLLQDEFDAILSSIKGEEQGSPILSLAPRLRWRVVEYDVQGNRSAIPAGYFQTDLLDAMASGRIAAATLDVFNDEPLQPDHPYWRHPRIAITPHISALTLPKESASQIAEKIRAMTRGEAIGGIVDKVLGY